MSEYAFIKVVEQMNHIIGKNNMGLDSEGKRIDEIERLYYAEFNRVLIHLENKSVYESAKILRDKYVLSLDNGKTVYLDFFSFDTDRNIYQVSHQITMDKDHKDDVSYKNRYDVTVLINGLPLVQIELKRPGVEINEAINQINRWVPHKGRRSMRKNSPILVEYPLYGLFRRE
jgi:type I restriction enzyme R subunit